MMGEMEGAIAEYKLSLDNDIRYMDGTRTRPLRYAHSVPLIVHAPAAYHSLARAISVLGDAESAVNILQVRTIDEGSLPDSVPPH